MKLKRSFLFLFCRHLSFSDYYLSFERIFLWEEQELFPNAASQRKITSNRTNGLQFYSNHHFISCSSNADHYKKGVVLWRHIHSRPKILHTGCYLSILREPKQYFDCVNSTFCQFAENLWKCSNHQVATAPEWYLYSRGGNQFKKIGLCRWQGKQRYSWAIIQQN